MFGTPIHRRRVAVKGDYELLPPTDVPCLPEYAFDRHICGTGAREEDELISYVKDAPICRIAEITSSIKLGTLKVALDAPCIVSAPSRSTRSSNGTPKRPCGHYSQHQPDISLTERCSNAPFFLMFFLSFPLNSFPQNPCFFASTISKISSKST